MSRSTQDVEDAASAAPPSYAPFFLVAEASHRGSSDTMRSAQMSPSIHLMLRLSWNSSATGRPVCRLLRRAPRRLWITHTLRGHPPLVGPDPRLVEVPGGVHRRYIWRMHHQTRMSYFNGRLLSNLPYRCRLRHACRPRPELRTCLYGTGSHRQGDDPCWSCLQRMLQTPNLSITWLGGMTSGPATRL